VTRGRLVRFALLVWVGSVALVVAAAVASKVPKVDTRRQDPLTLTPNPTALSRMARNWDARWYAQIATEGYHFGPAWKFGTVSASNVVFFPAYPMLVRAAHAAAVPLDWAMVLTANLAMAVALVVLAMYVRDRVPDEGARRFAVLAAALYPTTVFLHVGYTESLTLMLFAIAMWGMHRRWHPLAVAVVIGAATATRATGVALLAPFALYLWDRTAGRPTLGQRVAAALTSSPLLVVACWGLLAFMAVQQARFGTPVAFAKEQANWAIRHDHLTPVQKAMNLLTLESIRHTYSAASPLYWRKGAKVPGYVTNIPFMNPVYFVGAAVLLAVGWRRRWLDPRELCLGAMLLLIPYVSQSDRQGMTSEGRFTSVNLPIYLVLGCLLARMPRPLAYGLLACSGCLLFAYGLLFCAGYAVL
jgi:hypothetical protein